MGTGKKRMLVGLGETHMRVSCACYGDTRPNQRFWIISMMLVLVGLSTLKLR